MEEDGIITGTVYPAVPPRIEYALSELGGVHAADYWLYGSVGIGLSGKAFLKMTSEKLTVM